MWGREIRLRPGRLAPVEVGRAQHLFRGDQTLQRDQPVVVITRAVVCLAPVPDLPQHGGERRRPIPAK